MAEPESRHGVVWHGTVGQHHYDIRWAEHADYQTVMDIDHNVFEGLDYLPAHYHYILNDPAYMMFVMICEGRIIGFHGMYVCEEGIVAIGTGARVTESYRKIQPHPMQILDDVVVTLVRSLVPTLEKKRVTAEMTPGLRKHLSNPTTQDRLLEKSHFITGYSNKIHTEMALQAYEPLSTSIHVALPSRDVLEKILGDPENIEFLFPNGIFVSNYKWTPYNVSVKNLHKSVRENMVYVTFRDNANGNVETDRKCQSVSFSQICLSPVGPLANLHYYGIADNATLQAHVVELVRHLANVCDATSSFAYDVVFNEVFSAEEIGRLIAPLAIKQSLAEYSCVIESKL